VLKLSAKILSYLFHPLFMPTYGILLIFNLGGYISHSITTPVKYMILGVVFLNTFIFPAVSSLYLLKKGYINSMNMHSAQERRIPLMLTALFYFFTYYILQKAALPPVLFLIMLGAMLALLITLVINLIWKISTHMVGIGGIVGAVIGLSYKFNINLLFTIVLLLMVSGLVGASRLYLKSHSSDQIYTGFLIGVGSMLVILLSV
jgi:hypothetical protein